jgi:PTH1 family peptidyl-tRNA hydrolase
MPAALLQSPCVARASATRAATRARAQPSTLAPRVTCALGCTLLLRQLRFAADAAFSRVLSCRSARGSSAAAAAAAPVTTASARGAALAATSAGGGGDDADGMWLVVGLGNPGKQYAQTRHNVRATADAAHASGSLRRTCACLGVTRHALPRLSWPAWQVGFMAVDALAAAEGIQVATTQLRALVGKGVVAGKQVLLVKPQTFMNSSGESVVPLLKFYKVPPSRLLVVYDDLDIDVRSLRAIVRPGSAASRRCRSSQH